MDALKRTWNTLIRKGKPPFFWKQRSSMLFITTTVSVAIFTDIFMYGVLVPLTPFELPLLGIPKDQVQKKTSILLAVYSAVDLACSFPLGYLSDRYDFRRSGLLLGLVALFASTLLFMFSPSYEIMILARVISGVSAAAVWVTGLAVIADNAEEEKVGFYLGFVSSALNVGTAGGPVLGGLVYASSSTRGWMNTFGMCLGFIGVDIFLRLLMLEKRDVAYWRQLEDEKNPNSSQDQTSNRGGALKSLESNNRDDQNSKSADQEMSEKHLIVNANSKHEKKAELWMLLAVFKNSRSIVGFLLSFLIALYYGIIDATLPLQVVNWFQVNSIGAGLIYGALFIPIIIVGPLSGRLYDRVGGSIIALLGVIPLIAATFMLWIPPEFAETRTQQIGFLCMLLAISGISLSLIITPIFGEMATGVFSTQKADPEKFGGFSAINAAYGIFNACFTAGLLVGPFIGEEVIYNLSYKYISIILASLFAGTIPLIFFFVGGEGSLYRQIFYLKKLGVPPASLGERETNQDGNNQTSSPSLDDMDYNSAKDMTATGSNKTSEPETSAKLPSAS